jgi:hypothetical protein
MSDEIKIIPIPRAAIPALWMHLAPFLLRGLTAATDVTLKQLTDDLVSGEDTLWGIFEGNRARGAFVTALYLDEDSGKRFLGVYALGGEGLDRWAAKLGDTMAEHARRAGAASVRFCGRDAWSRVLPSYRVIGCLGREAVFERTVQ